MLFMSFFINFQWHNALGIVQIRVYRRQHFKGKYNKKIKKGKRKGATWYFYKIDLDIVKNAKL